MRAFELLNNKELLRIKALSGARGLFWGKKFRNGKETGEMCVQFLIPKKLESSEIEKGREIPKEAAGFQTDVIQSNPKLDLYSPTYSVIQPGISIGPEDYDSVGTLGGVFKDDSTGAAMGLTNFHVLASDWTSPWTPGAYAIHPGQEDGGLTNKFGRIGASSRWVLDSYNDSALIELSKNSAPFIVSQNVPIIGADFPMVNQICDKQGRSTGYTTGKINGIGWLDLDYTEFGYGEISMYLVAFIPNGDDQFEEIAQSGDSGSIWYDPSTNFGISLHVAHSLEITAFFAYGTVLGYAMLDLGISAFDVSNNDHSVWAVSFNFAERHDSCLSQSTFSLEEAVVPGFMARVNAVEDWEEIFSTLDEYAVSLGYADGAALLVDKGFGTELEYAESLGYESVADLLDDKSTKSLEDILSDAGITFS